MCARRRPSAALKSAIFQGVSTTEGTRTSQFGSPGKSFSLLLLVQTFQHGPTSFLGLFAQPAARDTRWDLSSLVNRKRDIQNGKVNRGRPKNTVRERVERLAGRGEPAHQGHSENGSGFGFDRTPLGVRTSPRANSQS